MKKGICILFVLCASIIFTSCGYTLIPRDTYITINEQNRLLNTEILILRNENDRLTTALLTLQENNVALQIELSALYHENYYLMRELELSQEHILVLQAELERLQQAIIELENELRNVRDQTVLLAEIHRLQTIIFWLENEIAILRNNNDLLQAEIILLRSRCNIIICPPIHGVLLGRDIRGFGKNNMLEVIAMVRPPVVTIMGVNYAYGITTDGTRSLGNATIFYNLNGRYSTFTGNFGPRDDSNWSRHGEFIISGDGIILGRFPVSTSDPLRQFFVNVSGVNQLRIDFVSSSVWGQTGYRFAIVNAVLR